MPRRRATSLAISLGAGSDLLTLEGFYLPFADHLAIFRYEDRPGMLGRVGTMLGEAGINIVSAAVGRRPDVNCGTMKVTTIQTPIATRSERDRSRTRRAVVTPTSAKSSM